MPIGTISKQAKNIHGRFKKQSKYQSISVIISIEYQCANVCQVIFYPN